MKLTAHDRIPIGKAKSGQAITNRITATARKEPERPVYRRRKSDRLQMSWRQLCITCGVNKSTFHYRVHRYGMTPLQALTTHVEPHQHVVMTMRDICQKVGLNYATYQTRRKRGRTVRQALTGEW